MIRLLSHRLLALVVVVAGLAGIGAMPVAAQAPDDTAPPTAPTPTLPSGDEITPGLPIPDDTGIVHSWGLAPGDGTAEAGERPNLSYELPPGGSVDDVVTLFNFSNVPLTFRVYATDGFNNDDGTFNLLPAETEPVDVGAWVTLPALEDGVITIGAGQQATFPITVSVPVDATPGDHVGALLASSEAVGTSPDNAIVTLDRRTGTRLTVRVSGPLRSELAVEDLEVDYTAAANPLGGSAEVTYTLANRGNVVLGGTQTLSVSGPLGMFAEELPAEDVPDLLPGETIEVTRTIDGVAASGLLFGRVEIEARAPLGAEPLDAAERSASTAAIPFTILALLLALIFLGLARRAYKRHRASPTVIPVVDPERIVIVPTEVIEPAEPEASRR